MVPEGFSEGVLRADLYLQSNAPPTNVSQWLEQTWDRKRNRVDGLRHRLNKAPLQKKI